MPSNLNSETYLDYKRKWCDFTNYKPHDGQMRLHFPEKPGARFTVGVCGRRWGKTVSASKEAE